MSETGAEMPEGPQPLVDPRLEHRRHDWRLVLVMAGFLVAYATVGMQMALTALGDPSEPGSARSAAAETPGRAPITDRAGRLLAANLPAHALYADPRQIRDPAAAARALVPIFPEIGEERLRKTLSADRRFVWVARRATPRQKAAVMDLQPAIPALLFGNRDMRAYPAGRLAAHIMGGVRADNARVDAADLIGTGGVERHFDVRLRSPDLSETPLALSIDLAVQTAMTEVIARGMRRTRAKGGMGILMNVHTGELLGLVSLPDFDPNAAVTKVGGKAANPRFNRAVSGIYELGSVFKPITAAIALETGIAGPGTLIETGTSVRFGRNRIRDLHRMPAYMTVADIIRRSSNTGTARLARRVGTKRFREGLGRLGFFEPTGIELGEARSGRPMLPPKWTELSTLTISFGHGLAISPLHLTAAYGTIANGGRLVQPSLVKGGKPLGPQVFSDTTSRQVVEMLRAVVARGTGRRTDVEGYEVAGKTGTADKARPGGGYFRDRTLASFAAVFPASRPEYALFVMLDEPTDPETGSRQASRTAVPVVAETVRRVAPLLGLRPLPTEPQPAAIAMEAVR